MPPLSGGMGNFMKIRVPEYYKDFACIGGGCIDTCCAGWEVDVDKKSSAYYKSVEGSFGDRLRSVLVDYPVEDRFILQEHGRCPFLNERNLCDIYTQLGEDKLCETCTNFPRHITEFGGTREIGISLSCPVAVELIMKRTEPIRFTVSDNDEPISGYNDIDAGLYYSLCQARELAYTICQDRALEIRQRAVLLLDFADALQGKLKCRKTDRIIGNYKDKAYLLNRLEKLEKKYSGSKKTSDMLLKWLRLYDSLEHIKPEWQGILNVLTSYVKKGMPDVRDNAAAVNERSYEYEHLLVYYVYRYFLRAVFDGELSGKVKLACTALIMQELLGAAYCSRDGSFSFNTQITLMRIYSKETEHSEENLEVLYKNFKKNKAFSIRNYMGIILGSGLFV